MSTSKRLRTGSNWIRALYALCLLGATINHAVMLWLYGFFWDYGGVPLATQVFWTSLTFVDPAAIVLLVLRPAAGVWLTLAIILSDVVHNTWFGLAHGMTANWMYYSQLAFLAFVLLTIRIVLRASLSGGVAPSSSQAAE
jgi:hypothetical protein